MTDKPGEVRTDPPSDADLKAQLEQLGVGDNPMVADPARADTLPEVDSAKVLPQGQPEPPPIPDKFKDASKEDVLKAYQELESKFSKENQKSGMDRLRPDGDTPEEVPKALEQVNWNKYADEFNSTGEIAEDSRKELVELGMPESLIDAHVEGRAAARDRQVDQMMSYVGGQETYNEMSTWMASNLPKDENDAFVESLASAQNMGTVEVLMKGMFARYQASPQGNTQQLTGRPESGSTTQAYRSQEEMLTAQADRRYGVDPAYRADVDARIAAMDPSLFRISSNI